MDPRFDDIVTDPQNQVFRVVFFPDRVYHAQYLNATRSARYRYNVREVRGKADINVLRGEVYMDGTRLCNFLRIEYRGARLTEVARERGRFLGRDVVAWVSLAPGTPLAAEAKLRMHHCPWIDAFQVELWETLEPPPGKRHDYQVLDLMGAGGSVTRVHAFAAALADLKSVGTIRLAFSENPVEQPSGLVIPATEIAWDNNFERNIQVPVSPNPSSQVNTVPEGNYGVDFRRGWFIRDVHAEIAPVRYSNAMMEPNNPHYRPPLGGVPQNVIEMRWVLQQEFGGTVVFFHEVTIPPNTFEGVHQHIGSEELYYIVEGTGTAFMGADDDPGLANAPVVTEYIFGLDPQLVRQIPVQPGSVIFTKSGGIHGIRNDGASPLRFVAFLYHSS